jgi:hypothetical protein
VLWGRHASSLIFFLNLLKNLLAVHRCTGASLYAKPNLLPFYLHDDNLDVISDRDSFADTSKLTRLLPSLVKTILIKPQPRYQIYA